MTIIEMLKNKIETMSAGQKKVGKYVLENYEKISYETLSEISKNAKVSETTVIRFCYSLGFDSFSNMQKNLQDEIYKKDKSKIFLKNDEENIYGNFIKTEISILEEQLKNLDESNLNGIIEKIANAKKIICVSSRAVYGMAYWLSKVLGNFKEDVTAVKPSTTETLEAITKVDKDTLIIAISLSRYSKETYRFVELAKKKNGTIIGVTDSLSSPVSILANDNLIVKNLRYDSGFNNLLPVMSVLNLLVLGLSKKYEKKAKDRILDIEKLELELDMFFE